ncbi:hypothetical protein [Mesorhizobium sp. M0701]|uniref:hypothetical protein n=1 Tax=Mesorhizobium sp. M0701 TaxID=2956989 RepID=UPI00333767F1
MSTNAISMQPFEAVYAVRQMGGGEHWLPCTVVGVMPPESVAGYGKFLILTEDEDGVLTVDVADAVTRSDG